MLGRFDLPFDFVSPWYLALLIFLPVFYLSSRRSLSGLSKRRKIVSVSLRLLVALCVILALAELRLRKKNENLAVIFVVDRSESVPAEQREAARQYILEKSRERAAAREDLAGVVAFGKLAGIESVPKKDALNLDSFVTLIEPEATDIAQAIRLAAAAFPEGVGKRIVVLSDGNENRESALEEARNARAHGITLDVVPITYSYPSEISIEKLLVDPEVHIGQPFDIRVVVDSTAQTDAILRLFENDKMVPQSDPKVALKPGKNVFDFRRRLELSGKYYYEARIEAVRTEDDNVLQNNTAFGFTFIQGEPKVLLCTNEPELEGPLISALNEEKIAVKTVTPDFLPKGIEDYFEYESIVLSNVAAHQLTEDQMKVFESLVQTVGIGFVMIGGEQSFGAGGYQGTPVERILPVDVEIKQKKVLPNGALAMVVHSCELGNGNAWARQVIQQALRILSPRDYAGVLYYDDTGGERWLFNMTPVSQRQTMLSLLSRFNPGDMMSFDPIMRMAFTGLQGTPAAIKHMIVLSDGDPSMPSASLVGSIVSARITISTICYGSHGVQPAGMKQLAAQAGGKFHFLQNPNSLPEIFIREATTVQRALISEERFLPIVASRHPILSGITAEDIPPLDGYVITGAKKLASTLLVHPAGTEDPIQDPVLAAWSYGVGKSVAFTSDAGRRWGKSWAAWKGYQRFWSQCMRWVSRVKNDDRFRLTRLVDGEKGSVTVDAITPDGQFLNGIEFKAKVTGPDLEPQNAAVRQVGPGRYITDFPVSRRGTYTVSLFYEKEGRPVSYVTGLSVPYSPEYRKLSTHHDLLRKIAEAGAGRYFEDPGAANFFTRDFPVTREVQDVWRHLLTLALVLFYADVFVRRVVIDYRQAAAKAWRGALSLVGRKTAAAPPDARLATLLERKAALRQAAAAKYEPKDRGLKSGQVLTPAAAPPQPAASKAEEKAAASPVKAVKAEEEAASEASYTSRLLEAKRRALKKDDKK